MNQKGITLLELMIVMVIIAIGALLTTPNISGWLPSLRLRSATRDVASILRVAQIKAVSTNTSYQVVFDTVNDNYFIQYQDTNGVWVADGGTQALPTGVKFNTTFGNTATFWPNSTATNGDVTLNNNKGTTKKIRLWGLTGRIKIE